MKTKQPKIEKLITELCPNGVEWKTLGEVAKIQRGASPRPINKYITKNEVDSVPWIKIGDTIHGSKYVSTTVQRITKKGAEKSRVLKKGDFIISNSMSFGRPYILNIDGAIHDGWASISNFQNRLLSDYLYYYLSSNVVQRYWESKINTSSVSNLNTEIIKTLPIPIPPLPVQEEIVRILDNFTQLEAELEAELEARKKQYEYYRNDLLSFNDNDVEWKTLGEVGEFVRGNGLQKKDFVESGVGCIHYGQIYTYYGLFTTQTKSFVSESLAKRLKKANHGDIIFATVSENIEDVCKTVAWLGEDEICVSGDSLVFKHNQNPKYISYYLRTPSFFEYKKSHRTGTKVIRLHSDKLKKFPIPIPPLKEQERIVSILDKFDALVNDISQGLPAEISARKKQYEYYRNKLLTFENINSNG